MRTRTAAEPGRKRRPRDAQHHNAAHAPPGEKSSNKIKEEEQAAYRRPSLWKRANSPRSYAATSVVSSSPCLSLSSSAISRLQQGPNTREERRGTECHGAASFTQQPIAHSNGIRRGWRHHEKTGQSKREREKAGVRNVVKVLLLELVLVLGPEVLAVHRRPRQHARLQLRVVHLE